MGIPVTEKDHLQKQITELVDARIAEITASDPQLEIRLREQILTELYEEFDIGADIAKAVKLTATMHKLQRRVSKLQQRVARKLSGFDQATLPKDFQVYVRPYYGGSYGNGPLRTFPKEAQEAFTNIIDARIGAAMDASPVGALIIQLRRLRSAASTDIRMAGTYKELREVHDRTLSQLAEVKIPKAVRAHRNIKVGAPRGKDEGTSEVQPAKDTAAG